MRDKNRSGCGKLAVNVVSHQREAPAKTTQAEHIDASYVGHLRLWKFGLFRARMCIIGTTDVRFRSAFIVFLHSHSDDD